jgi:fructose-1,6-bisphosphatase/inositol monophosphatase family enzyme
MMLEHRDDFGPLQMKGRGNFLTEIDLAVERAAIETLRAEYPEHRVLSEETSAEVEDWDQGWLWVIDPIDGTHNYVKGNPNFCFNIALCHDGEPLLGLTYAPVADEEYFAVQGGGLTINRKQARVSEAASIQESVWGMDLGYDDGRAAKLLRVVTEVWPNVQALRLLGSAALGIAFAASGRYDLFVHQKLSPWDLAAGIVLVREGGGEIVNHDGGPVTIGSEGIVAGAPGVVREFVGIVRQKEREWR